MIVAEPSKNKYFGNRVMNSSYCDFEYRIGILIILIIRPSLIGFSIMHLKEKQV